MADHTHDWYVSHYVFPEQGEEGLKYEYDVPYKVEVCNDPECGQRRSKELSKAEEQEVRAIYAVPAETVKYDRNEVPAEETNAFGTSAGE